MEMHAVLHGLGSLWKTYGPSDVLIRSDSQYVVLGASDSGRKRMKNVDYWEMIDAHVALHNCVVFEHVRGHSGDHYNDRVDKLAGTARKRGKC